MKYGELLCEAQCLSMDAGAGTLDTADLADGHVHRAQEALTLVIMDSFDAKVKAAAESGRRHAVLFEFKGKATFPGYRVTPAWVTSAEPESEFFYLHLIKGPRVAPGDQHRHRKRKAKSAGVTPLIDTLDASVRPFVMRHVWTEGTDDNAIIVEW